ncbi:hypothetical protein ATO3_26405 [Marinibacterium profundimaris]|uniref:Uncharacterized protein n=1 Tax=Marinibacterium profundimaris TaxID=1679460 RepID=A0A225NHM9_9RHOB|nr:hypothetical protein ATO3_26405 [Marinibacterium profundimaris]
MPDKIVPKRVFEWLTIQDASKLELKVLKLVLPIVHLAQNICLLGENIDHIFFGHDSVDVLIEFIII